MYRVAGMLRQKVQEWKSLFVLWKEVWETEATSWLKFEIKTAGPTSSLTAIPTLQDTEAMEWAPSHWVHQGHCFCSRAALFPLNGGKWTCLNSQCVWQWQSRQKLAGETWEPPTHALLSLLNIEIGGGCWSTYKFSVDYKPLFSWSKKARIAARWILRRDK